jgi:hypothetical protein
MYVSMRKTRSHNTRGKKENDGDADDDDDDDNIPLSLRRSMLLAA